MKRSSNKFAVILCGGVGSRFWPLSRELEPKQFLKLNGNKTLFQQTIKRILPLIPPQNIYIVGNCLHNFQIKRQIVIFSIPQTNIILEPEGKSTAPAIGLAARLISLRHPEAIMLVFPSDHFISNERNFLQTLKEAAKLAEKDYLVTLGIPPNTPHTGYGYIKIDRQLPIANYQKNKTYQVEKFVEKPNLKKAKEFVKDKRYFWNSGMFIWKARVILEELKTYLPDLSKGLREIDSCSIYGAEMIEQPTFRRIWNQIETISVDYGILEKSRRTVVVVAKNIGWSDLGSWSSLAGVLPKDKNGNIIQGDSIDIGSKNTAIFANSRLIATIGLKDIIIADTDDALLVCNKDCSEDVRKVVRVLKRNGRLGHLLHKTIKRSWENTLR